jgi:hypothetical protein
MKILLLSIFLLPVSLNSSAPQSEPVSPPEPLCTPGVAPSECKLLDGLLTLRQTGSGMTASVRFVIADDAAFKDEKHRVETMQANIIANAPKGSVQKERAVVAPDFILSPFGQNVLFELVERNHLRIAAVYFNETASCHDKDSNFDNYGCVGVIEYAMGFIEGMILGSNNVMNSLAIGH